MTIATRVHLQNKGQRERVFSKHNRENHPKWEKWDNQQMLQNLEVICKHLAGWRTLKQFSICQTPEIETDELVLWTSTTAPAEKADPFCQGSLVKTVDCKSEFSFLDLGYPENTAEMFICASYLGQEDDRPWSLKVCGGEDKETHMSHALFLTFPWRVRRVPKRNNPHFNCIGK